METIEDLNFTRPIYNFLRKKGINTIEDLKNIDYKLITIEKDIYNAVTSRLHSKNILYTFEIPFYEVLIKRLQNGEPIEIEENTISGHTKTALRKLNIKYIDELAYLDMESLNKLKNNELGEVLCLLKIFNIKLSDSYDNRLIYLNQEIEELILSDRTIFELKAVGCTTLSDYIHKDKNSVLPYLSKSTIEEIEGKINEFSLNDTIPLEIKVKILEKEIIELNDINDKKKKELEKLTFLINEKERLLDEIKNREKEIKILIKTQKD